MGAYALCVRAASIIFRSQIRNGAEVAQSVEHMTENHGVAGSIPALGTSPL
jgi:hypothetical protein